jgi:beta-lactamase class A
MKKVVQIAGVVVLLCAVSGFIGWSARNFYMTKQSVDWMQQIRENRPEYKFINPLLLVDNPNEAAEYANLKHEVETYVGTQLKENNVETLSVYFRDLNSGKWTGINEDVLYAPSSMLKVAVMIGFLKKITMNPNIILEKLAYTAQADPGQHYPPSKPLKTGTYSVVDLIQAMILDSDNLALKALYERDRQAFIDVLKELDIQPPPDTSTEDFISPKIYSKIFRTLYSSSYLPRDISEDALELLSYTTFKKGLVAGVPSHIPVSHKFGEHTNTVSGKVVYRQLHDCGIVYFPSGPYFLCVMTKGSDFAKLETVIAGISKVVFDQVKSLND